MANATTEEEPLAPGDAPADAPAEQAEQQTPIMEGGFPVPDVVALAAEFLAQLKEQIAETEGLEPLEDGWRCEVKIRAKITPMGPRVDKVRRVVGRPRNALGASKSPTATTSCCFLSLFPPRHLIRAPPPTAVLLRAGRQDAAQQRGGGAVPAEPAGGGAHSCGRPPNAALPAASPCP